ncbi:MAG: glucose dehydrogenase [Planctomycetaceae bacterium]|nr:glucose dehydrogenase [Planctomycetaceae bacterium]
MNLAGKTALVTGAGRGIGRGCALELARAGADLVINDRPGGTDAEESAQEIRTLGRNCTVVEADAFSRAGCETICAQALESAGQIDILVSNPAYSHRGTFLEYDPDLFERTINGTLVGGFHMSQLVARHMIEQSTRGKLVFISSVQAQMPMALCSAYGAAKAGLNHLARSIAVELSPHRINVNVIEPGWIDTPGEHEEFGDDVIQREAQQLPWGRLGTPQDIGQAAAFLCSDEADYITGTVLPVDGLFRFKDCRRAEGT